MASEMMDHVRGILTLQKQPRGLAPQLAVTFVRHDHLIEQVVEIGDADHFLGRVDVVELLGQKALDQRYA